MGNSLEVCCLKNSNKNNISEPSRKNGKASKNGTRISKLDLQRSLAKTKASEGRNRVLSQSLVIDDQEGNLSLGNLKEEMEKDFVMNMT